MWQLRRLPGETINNLLARFDTIRHVAQIEGNFVMSVEGYAMTLPSVIGIDDKLLLHVTARYQNQLPITEEHLQDMVRFLRRESYH